MFRIIKAGAGIGLTENLNYIKKAENGCYILCPEHDASGIVFEGVAYHLLGRAAMDELETVSLGTDGRRKRDHQGHGSRWNRLCDLGGSREH